MYQQPEYKVRKNRKIKVYTDGTTNSVICCEPIFRDPFDEPESTDENNLYKSYKVSLKTLYKAERLEAFEKFIESHSLTVENFEKIIESEDSENFLFVLSDNNISMREYDYFSMIYKKMYPQAKSKNLNDPRSDSVKRAKDSIFDYVLNNDFDYFYTGTIDPVKLDSTDPKVLLKPLLKWLNNMQQRYGLQYLMIAEHHKSGRIHFHGLFKSDSLRLVDSGTKLYKGHNKPISDERAAQIGLSDGRTVYNLASWRFGFSTCIALTGDRMNTAFYITKYITKDCKKIFGKFFWHSQSLKKPDILYDNIDFDSVDALDYNGFKYVFNRGEDNRFEMFTKT